MTDWNSDGRNCRPGLLPSAINTAEDVKTASSVQSTISILMIAQVSAVKDIYPWQSSISAILHKAMSMLLGFPRSFIEFFGFLLRLKRHMLLLPLLSSVRSTERIFIVSASQLLASPCIPEEGLSLLQPQRLGLYNPEYGPVPLCGLTDATSTGHICHCCLQVTHSIAKMALATRSSVGSYVWLSPKAKPSR